MKSTEEKLMGAQFIIKGIVDAENAFEVAVDFRDIATAQEQRDRFITYAIEYAREHDLCDTTKDAQETR